MSKDAQLTNSGVREVMRMREERAWNECADEAYERGLMHEEGRDEMRGRNPWREGGAA